MTRKEKMLPILMPALAAEVRFDVSLLLEEDAEALGRRWWCRGGIG